MRRILVMVVATFLMASGAMAQDSGKMDKNMGRIYFSGFPVGATVIIDGREAGKIGEGEMTHVPISPGNHMVAVKDGNKAVFREKVFIEKGKDRLFRK